MDSPHIIIVTDQDAVVFHGCGSDYRIRCFLADNVLRPSSIVAALLEKEANASKHIMIQEEPHLMT